MNKTICKRIREACRNVPAEHRRFAYRKLKKAYQRHGNDRQRIRDAMDADRIRMILPQK